MKKIFTFCLFIITIHNLFGQNCNLQFGIKNDTENGRYTDDYGRFRVCNGVPVSLIADEIPNATYQWYLDNKIIIGANQNIYEVKDISGSFTVKATIGNCTYSRTMKSIYMRSVSYGISSNSDSQIICEQNSNVFLYTYAVASSNKNAKYQWQKDKVDIEGANNYYYYAQKSGIYSVRISQGECNTTTPLLELKPINQTNTKIIIGGVSYSKDTIAEFCSGTSVQLQIEYLPYLSNTYKVYKDNQLIALKNYENISESGKYRIEFMVGDCKLITPTIDVRFGNNMPKFFIEKVEAKSFKPCNTETLALGIGTTFINGNNYTAEWKKNGIIQKENGFSFLNVTTPGTYSIILKKGSCQRESEKVEIKSLNTELIPLRALDFPNKKLEGCFGQSFVLNPYAYSSYAIFDLYKDGKVVFPQPNSNGNIYMTTESGKYYLIYSEPNGGGCTRYSDTLEVVIKNKINNNLIINNTQCQNGIFHLSVPQEEGLIYAWKKDGKLLSNANNSTFTTKEKGNYSVVVNQDFCSIASPEIAVGAKIIVNSTTCEGQTLQLSAGKANSYEWTGPNGFAATLQNPSIVNLSTVNQGYYYLKVTNDNSCTFRDSVFIKVNPSPIFSAETQEVICLGKSFTITTKSLNNNSFYYNMSSPDNVNFVFSNGLTRDNATQQMAGVYKITATDLYSAIYQTIRHY